MTIKRRIVTTVITKRTLTVEVDESLPLDEQIHVTLGRVSIGADYDYEQVLDSHHEVTHKPA